MRKSHALIAVAISSIFAASSSVALELNAVLLPKCPVKGAPEKDFAPIVAGIVASLAGNLVSGVLDGLAAELKADGSFSRTRTLPLEGLYVATVDEKDPKSTVLHFAYDSQCLVVAVADGFAKANKTETSLAVVRAALPFAANLGGGIAPLYDALGLRSNPVFYAEFGLFSGGYPLDTVFIASPQWVYYPDWVVSGWRYADNRDVGVILEWSKPSEGSPFAATHVTLTNASKAALEKDTNLFAWKSGWMSLAGTNGLASQLTPGKSYLPVNLKVGFTETAHPNVFATALAQTLSDSKASLKTAAQNAVDQALEPSKKAAAEVSSATTFVTAEQAYTDSYNKAVGFKDAYGKATTAEAKQVAKASFNAQVATLPGLAEVARQAAIAMGNEGAFTRLDDLPPPI